MPDLLERLPTEPSAGRMTVPKPISSFKPQDGDRKPFTDKKELVGVPLVITSAKQITGKIGEFFVIDATRQDSGEAITFTGSTAIDQTMTAVVAENGFPVSAALTQVPADNPQGWYWMLADVPTDTPPAPPEQREGVAAATASPAQPAAPSAAPSDERPDLRKAWWGLVQTMGFTQADMKSYVAAKYPLYEGGTKDMTADELEAEIAVFSALDEMGAKVIKDSLAAGTFAINDAVKEATAPLSDEDFKRYTRRLTAVAKEACGHKAADIKKELGITSFKELTTHDQWLAAISRYEAKTQPPTPER